MTGMVGDGYVLRSYRISGFSVPFFPCLMVSVCMGRKTPKYRNIGMDLKT